MPDKWKRQSLLVRATKNCVVNNTQNFSCSATNCNLGFVRSSYVNTLWPLFLPFDVTVKLKRGGMRNWKLVKLHCWEVVIMQSSDKHTRGPCLWLQGFKSFTVCWWFLKFKSHLVFLFLMSKQHELSAKTLALHISLWFLVFPLCSTGRVCASMWRWHRVQVYNRRKQSSLLQRPGLLGKQGADREGGWDIRPAPRLCILSVVF